MIILGFLLFFRAGFEEVRATDLTQDFVDVLNKEMSKFRGMKEEFIKVWN